MKIAPLLTARILSILLLLPAAPLQANNVWVGGVSSGNFSDVANWSSAPSWSYSNNLVFQANTSATTLNFNIAPQPVNDIYFETLFPVARTLQTEPGGAIYFKTRLENLSAYTQTINMPLLGGYDGALAIQLNPVGGSLVMNGDFYNDFNKSYAVFGSETANVTSLTLNTGIGLRGSDQASINFTVASGRNIAVQVNASQIWQGRTEIQAGTFTTASGVQLASSDIFLNGGDVITTSANTISDSAKLRVNAGQLSVGGSDTVASLEGTGGSVVISSSATLSVGAANTSTSYAGAITGLGSMAKVGSGVLALSGTNTYTGATTVAAGTLRVNGSTAASAFGVQSGATLGGSGTVGSTAIESGGTLSPGNSPGNLTVSGNLEWNGGANYNWQVLGTTNTAGFAAGTTWDLVTVTGTLDLTALTAESKFNINLWSLASTGPDVNGNITDFDPTTSYEWLAVVASNITGFNESYFNVNYEATNGTAGFGNTTDPGYTFGVRQDGGNLYVTYEAVPEPSTYALLALSAAGLGGYVLRRRRK